MITSAEEFVTLRTSDVMDEYQRAAHSEAPESVWLDVIQNYPEMREWVAYNKTVPLSILQILADDPDDRVRWTVATRRKLDVGLFEKLAKDPDEGVRDRIVYNAKVPLHVLQALAQDPCVYVRENAQQRIASRK